jgi:2-polyprenyl-3-methyl-5-hydroxy-6-metoxy-1,4-benzoquinol methylase
MFRWLQDIFASKYETSTMLDSYISAQYGAFATPKITTTEPFYQTILSLSKTHVENKKCLDIGCGTGRLVFEYVKDGASFATGTDLSKSFIKTCIEIRNGTSSLTEYSGNFSNSEFLIDDILDTKLQPNTFGFISCVNVIDRVKDPFQLIEIIWSLLEPDGALLLSDPYDWKNSPAEKSLHKSNLKEYLEKYRWEILKEETDIPFHIPYEGYVTKYNSDIVVARKKN